LIGIVVSREGDFPYIIFHFSFSIAVAGASHQPANFIGFGHEFSCPLPNNPSVGLKEK
jgi:hypothetical protein